MQSIISVFNHKANITSIQTKTLKKLDDILHVTAHVVKLEAEALFVVEFIYYTFRVDANKA